MRSGSPHATATVLAMATVVAVLITPIVITAGFSSPEKYGPVCAAILSLIAWAYIAGMTYIAFRAIGKMFEQQ